MTQQVIRASEIGQYAFCAWAWWLGRVRGIALANVRRMQAGVVAHHRHGRQVRAYHWLHQAAYILLTIALLLAPVGIWLMLHA